MSIINKFSKLSTPAKVVMGVGGVAGVIALASTGVLATAVSAVAAAGAALLGSGGQEQRPTSPYGAGRGRIATSTSKVPNTCQGEYRILDAQNDVKYVGVVASPNRSLQDRIREHEKTRMFDPAYGDRVQYFAACSNATKEQIYRHEQLSIKKHNPYMNKCKGGNGPR